MGNIMNEDLLGWPSPIAIPVKGPIPYNRLIRRGHMLQAKTCGQKKAAEGDTSKAMADTEQKTSNCNEQLLFWKHCIVLQGHQAPSKCFAILCSVASLEPETLEKIGERTFHG